MQKDIAEKRKYPRLNSRIPMRYRKIETSTQEFQGSLMKDISEGGTRMTISEFLPLNSKLAMEIPLMPGRRPVKGVSRVAWVAKAGFSERYDVGVEFVELDQEDSMQIAKFILNKALTE